MPDKFDNQGSDFQSLLRSPEYDPKKAGEEEKEAKKVSTQFEDLREGLNRARRREQKRTITDLLIDGVTPFLIFVMVLSITWFLLDVRYIFTESEHVSLRLVAFCLIMGVVALNRLVAREGVNESIIYIIGLGVVTMLYTYSVTEYTGSIARSFLDKPGAAAFFNLFVVSLLWWVTNRLTHECCVDENQTAGDVGILTGTAQSFQAAIQPQKRVVKKKKGPSTKRSSDHILETTTVDAVDPLDWNDPDKQQEEVIEEVAPTQRLAKRHPGISIFYFTVPVMAIFALGLPVLMQGGSRFINAGHAYVGLFTTSALALLMLTSLGGLRQYFRARRIYFPERIGAFWITLGSIMLVTVLLFAISMPMPGLPRMAVIAEHETDYWTKTSTFELQSPAGDLTESVQDSQILPRLRVFVFVCMALFFLFAFIRGVGYLAAYIGRNRWAFPPFIADFFNRLDQFLVNNVKIPKLPTIKRRRRIHPGTAQCTKFQNPMKGEASVERDKVEQYVAQAYDALCALAYDMGAPRDLDQTPYEFLAAFPKEMKDLKEEAEELTELYVRTAYSKLPPSDRVLDRLRKFWTTYEVVRSRYVR